MLSYTFQFKKKVINLVFVSVFVYIVAILSARVLDSTALKSIFIALSLPYHCCTLHSFFFSKTFFKKNAVYRD